VQVLPESQTVQPAQFVPPHWAHLAAVQAPGAVAVADADEVVLVAGALEVVEAAEVVVEEEEEEEAPPDEPIGGC
jgi:nicotinamide mononucleotide adenylyltransferase